MDRKQKIWNEARDTVNRPSRIRQIIDQASQKLRTVSSDSPELEGAINKTQVLIKMLRAHVKGDYRAFSTRTIALIIFALLYFVIPTDVVPDFLPALGFTDDLSILYFVFRQVDADVQKFTEAQSESL